MKMICTCILIWIPFEIFPWRPQTGKVARLICDIHKCDGTPFEGTALYIKAGYP